MRCRNRLSSRRLALIGAVALATLLVSPAAFATHGPDTEVTTGSNDAVMLQNKQNEPWVAINLNDPTQVAAGANDNLDLEACNVGDDTTCPFTPGVGVSGVAFLNAAGTWTQPTYTGFSKRHCLGVAGVSTDTCPARTPTTTPPGEIGTLPWYYEAGLTSDGDPALAFGPKPTAGGFSWSNGARLYYANLTSNLFAERNEALKGFEGVAVSRTDNVAAAAAGGAAGKAAWMPPVVVSKQSGASFNDKESIAADDASSSPFFGNVYVCYTAFRSVGGAPNPIFVARSTDGGSSWEQRHLSEASNTGLGSGRQGCDVDTDSDGVVYVVWRGGETPKDNPPLFNRGIFLSRSFDGGVSFENPRQVARVQECGLLDPNQGRTTFDGVAGARTSLNPSLDVANGAPTGANAPDTLVLTWCDGPTPRTAAGANEEALVQLSGDKGQSWTAPVNAADTTTADRPDFPSVAISPDGTDLYLTYMAFHAPWQSTTAAPRIMEGVVRHADLAGTVPGTFATIHRGAPGDARGSSTNGLVAEFLGDYNYVAATNDFAYAVWNDVRNAADCPAVDTYRQNLVTGTVPNPTPAPQQDCPAVGTAVFGNSDIFGTRVNDPS
jgi:hypothetical protein